MELFMLGLVLLVFAVSPFVLLVLHLLARDRLNKLERATTETRERFASRIDELETRLGRIDRTDELEQDWGPPAEGVPAPSAYPPSAPVTPAPGRLAPASPTLPAPPASKAPASRSSAEWEELIGGSWLNKIGSVVLVVGIALTLGYSMRWLGPFGRVGLGLAMSTAMLAGGVLLEKRERYRMAARGLIGGGWAGVYFTTFATHGLAAARIVADPVIATGLLIAVAAAMLRHAVSYRSETVTALAYLVTFGTLAVVPATRFALAASVPAVVSLLYIGGRFRWAHMTVAGVVLTYGAYLLRGGAPDVGPDDWAFGQTLLFFYWIVFEAFDVLSLRRRPPGGIDQTIMPINAAGFLGVSLLGWSDVRPESLWLFFLLASGCFAASAAFRARSIGGVAESPAGGSFDDPSAVSAIVGGGYAASLSIATALLVFAIERGFDGWRENVAWLLLAQLLVLGGIRLRNGFMRHLGSGVLVVPTLALLFRDLSSSRTVVLWGHTWWESTPIALLTAAILYGNRAFLRQAAGVRVGGLERLYTGTATLIVAALLATELPDVWIAPSWFVLGLALVGLGIVRCAGELYVQGHVAIAAAWLVAMLGNVPTDDLVMGWPARWSTALPMVVVLYVLAYAARSSGPAMTTVNAGNASGEGAMESAPADARFDAVAARLSGGSSVTMSAAATVLTTWFLFYEVSGSWLTVAWGLQGVALLGFGLLVSARSLRLGGLMLLGLCIAKLFAYDLSELDTLFQIFSFVILGTLLIAVSFAYGRFREQIRRLL